MNDDWTRAGGWLVVHMLRLFGRDWRETITRLPPSAQCISRALRRLDAQQTKRQIARPNSFSQTTLVDKRVSVVRGRNVTQKAMAVTCAAGLSTIGSPMLPNICKTWCTTNNTDQDSRTCFLYRRWDLIAFPQIPRFKVSQVMKQLLSS